MFDESDVRLRLDYGPKEADLTLTSEDDLMSGACVSLFNRSGLKDISTSRRFPRSLLMLMEEPCITTHSAHSSWLLARQPYRVQAVIGSSRTLAAAVGAHGLGSVLKHHVLMGACRPSVKISWALFIVQTVTFWGLLLTKKRERARRMGGTRLGARGPRFNGRHAARSWGGRMGSAM